MKITKWTHFVIIKVCFHNALPHFQHGCISILMQLWKILDLFEHYANFQIALAFL